VVIEEGDPYLVKARAWPESRSEDKSAMYRFWRVERRPRAAALWSRITRPGGQALFPASLLRYVPDVRTRAVFVALKNLDCYVAGDIGCYSLGVPAAI